VYQMIAKSVDTNRYATPRRLCSANVVAIEKASDVNTADHVGMRT